MFRGFAVVLIVFSSGAMGVIIARSFSNQVNNLRQLITFIQVLESEIQFARTTLPQVLTAQVPQFSGVIGKFLRRLSIRLQEGTGEPFPLIWEEGLAILGANGLPKSALEDLRSLGDVLGMSDSTEQGKHLKVLLHHLEQALQHAGEERDKQTRLWQYLGFSAGLLICLLLL